MNMKNVCEELEKLQEQKKLYTCELNHEDIYDLYVKVCLELGLIHRH